MSRITAGCCESSGSGVPSGFVNAQEITFENEISKTGDTASVEAEWLMDFDLFSVGASLNLDGALWVMGDTPNVDACVAIYIGGTRGAVDGTLVANTATLSATFTEVHIASSVSFVNPGGRRPVKVVLFSQDDPDPAAGATAFIQGLTLVILK